ncbi:MAG: hypothetical protein L7H05_04360, partial [Vulcanisaeta sp.]|nr:hypothetical protein [Vulcanisaeta sp.]
MLGIVGESGSGKS